jgi:hypothetical protein
LLGWRMVGCDGGGAYVEAFLPVGGFVEGHLCGVADGIFAHGDEYLMLTVSIFKVYRLTRTVSNR